MIIGLRFFCCMDGVCFEFVVVIIRSLCMESFFFFKMSFSGEVLGSGKFEV